MAPPQFPAQLVNDGKSTAHIRFKHPWRRIKKYFDHIKSTLHTWSLLERCSFKPEAGVVAGSVGRTCPLRVGRLLFRPSATINFGACRNSSVEKLSEHPPQRPNHDSLIHDSSDLYTRHLNLVQIAIMDASSKQPVKLVKVTRVQIGRAHV